MMISQELISSNGVSPIALTFFTALLGVMLEVLRRINSERKAARDAKMASEEAAEAAKAAAANTERVGNGFAGKVLGSLESIDRKVERSDERLTGIEETLRDHLKWHLENERKTQ